MTYIGVKRKDNFYDTKEKIYNIPGVMVVSTLVVTSVHIISVLFGLIFIIFWYMIRKLLKEHHRMPGTVYQFVIPMCATYVFWCCGVAMCEPSWGMTTSSVYFMGLICLMQLVNMVVIDLVHLIHWVICKCRKVKYSRKDLTPLQFILPYIVVSMI